MIVLTNPPNMRPLTYPPIDENRDNWKAIVTYLSWLNRIRRRNAAAQQEGR